MGYDFTLEDRDARVLPERAGAPLELEIEGRRVRAALERGTRDGEWLLTLDGRRERLFIAAQHDVLFVHWAGRAHRVEAWNALDRAHERAIRAGGSEEIRAPMPGVVVAIAVRAGEAVETGALLLTIESMKLQTAITATHPARVEEVCVAAGEHFDQGRPLVRLMPLDPENRVAEPTAPAPPTPRPPSGLVEDAEGRADRERRGGKKRRRP